MQDHMQTCERCQRECARLTMVLGEIRNQCAPLEPGMFPAVMADIRKWETGRLTPEEGARAVKRRVQTEIEPFLGREAAAQLLNLVPDDGSNLLSTIELVLGQFLGSRAASELMGRVVDHAIMRT